MSSKFIFIALLVVASSFALNYTLSPDGKYVSWENANALINCTAYSHELVHQSQICNFTYKSGPNINLNTSLVFDSETTPKNAYIWQNYSHEETEYRAVIEQETTEVTNVTKIETTSTPCDWGLENSTYKRNVTFLSYYGERSSVYCFNSFINNSGNYSLTSLVSNSKPFPINRTYPDWKSISNLFTLSSFGDYKVGTTGASWTAGQSRLVKFEYDTKPNTDGKFDIYFHTGSAQEAKADPSKIKLVLDPWWNGTWLKRVPCYVNTTVETSLSNFPAHCILNTQALIGNGSMLSTCADLRVTNNSETPLDYEIENGTCNTTTTVIWARIPATSNSSVQNDTLWIYYNNSAASDGQNASGVWSPALYTSVWHGADLSDSLGINNMTQSGTVSFSANTTMCKFGKCFDYDSTTEYLTKSGATHTIGTGNRTVSLWGYFAVTGFASHTFDLGTQSGNNGETMFITNEGPWSFKLTGYGGSSNATYMSPVLNQSKFMLGYMVNSTSTRWIFTNSSTGIVFNTTSSGVTSITSGVINIGGTGYTWGKYGRAALDEVRLANTSRTTDWLSAEYAQTDYIGTEESATAITSALSVTMNSPANTTYTLRFINVSALCIGDNASYLVNFTANGNNIIHDQSTNNNSQFSQIYEFTSNGGYQINATCWNGTYMNTSSSIYFTVNDVAPTVGLVAPLNNTASQNTTWQFAWMCNDTGNTTVNYRLFLDNIVNKTGTCNNATACTDNIAGINVSDHYWNVECSDGLYAANASNAFNFSVINISAATQAPADLTSTNAFTTGVYINYTINNSNSTPYLFYKVNNSVSDSLFFLNGTQITGYRNNTCTNVTEILQNTTTWQCRLFDIEVYPATYNFDEDTIEAGAKSNSTLDATAKLFKMQFYNVSNITNYSFFEINAYNTTTTTSPLRIYYCNSTYTTGNIQTSPNCVLFASLPRTSAYNHSHGSLSSHHILPLGLNSSTGQIGAIKVTATSYLIARGPNSGGWNITYTTDVSRADAYQTSANTGASYSNLAGTADAHIHQFSDNDTLRYFISVAPSNQTWVGQNASNSTESSDLMGLGDLPPSTPIIQIPSNATYSIGTPMNITYLQSISPNNYPITTYNISLYNLDYTYNSTIQGNNSNNLSYLWDFDLIAQGAYIIGVNATDNLGQNSTTAFSDVFTISSTILNFVSPTPLNGVNNFTYGMVFNYSSTTVLGNSDNYIEIDGTNRTCTLGAGNLSCSYTLPYTEHLFNNSYDLKAWANISGTYNTNATLYNFSYYGCGYIQSNATMLGHANRTGGTCFTTNATNNLIINGAGYAIGGNDAATTTGIHINYTNNTVIQNAIIENFYTGIYTQGTETNVTNTTIRDCSYGMDIESGTNLTNSSIYNNTIIGIQVRGTESVIYNNSIYNNTNTNLYIAANNVNASDNLLYNSTIGIDARERNNVSFSFNHYHNNTWDLAINGTNYNATYELFDSNGSMANYTNISFSVANTNGTINLTWARNSSTLPSGTRSFIGKYLNISSGAGTPILDTITFNWLTTEIGTFTESKFHLYKYNGTWTDLNNTPDTANNQLKLSALYPAGHYAIMEWWNDTLCLNLINAYGVNQNTSQYLNYSDVWLYIVAENITLNNTCPVDLINVDYKINESTANASWITRLVSFNANEVKNVSNYSYRIPMVSSDLGEIGAYASFFYPNNHHYRFNSTYTSRNVSNLQINISSHGSYRQLYNCEDSVSCNLSAEFGSPLTYSLDGTRILRSGDALGMLIEYVVSWENNGGVGPIGGGDGGVAPISIPTPANATPTLAIATDDEGQIDLQAIKDNWCCLGAAILVLLFLMIRRKSE